MSVPGYNIVVDTAVTQRDVTVGGKLDVTGNITSNANITWPIPIELSKNNPPPVFSHQTVSPMAVFNGSQARYNMVWGPLAPGMIAGGTANSIIVRGTSGYGQWSPTPLVTDITVVNITTILGDLRVNGSSGTAGQFMKKISLIGQAWTNIQATDIGSGAPNTILATNAAGNSNLWTSTPTLSTLTVTGASTIAALTVTGSSTVAALTSSSDVTASRLGITGAVPIANNYISAAKYQSVLCTAKFINTGGTVFSLDTPYTFNIQLQRINNVLWVDIPAFSYNNSVTGGPVAGNNAFEIDASVLTTLRPNANYLSTMSFQEAGVGTVGGIYCRIIGGLRYLVLNSKYENSAVTSTVGVVVSSQYSFMLNQKCTS